MLSKTPPLGGVFFDFEKSPLVVIISAVLSAIFMYNVRTSLYNSRRGL
jgi:hypothetical protein